MEGHKDGRKAGNDCVHSKASGGGKPGEGAQAADMRNQHTEVKGVAGKPRSLLFFCLDVLGGLQYILFDQGESVIRQSGQCPDQTVTGG